jgi:pimeloyl-ACP methyl ester carboxylesterase
MGTDSLHVEELGRGNERSVLLLHAAATSGWMWGVVARRLAEEFHVLIPDLPGHGRSNRLTWRSLRETARLVDSALADRAHDGAAHVVGLSLGGYVSLETAVLSSRIRSLMVSGVNVLPFPHPGWMRAVGRVIEPVLKSDAFLRFNARSLRIPRDQVAGFREAAKAADPASLRTVNAEALHYRIPEHAGRTATPVLAVAGAKEHQLILRSLPEIQSAFPNAVAGTAPDGHHGWNGEQPDLFARVVREWIDEPVLPAGLLPAGPANSSQRPSSARA